MLIEPIRRKVLRYKKLFEESMSDKPQVLFILNNESLHIYNNLVSQFNNSNIQINIVDFIGVSKNNLFNYFLPTDLDWLFEVCEFSYLVKDTKVITYDLDIVKDIKELNSISKKLEPIFNDEVSIILSHVNTSSKKEVLIECIKSLRKKGQKIILSSHLNVDNDIVDLVDYFIYDKKNRMIEPHEFDGFGRTWSYFKHNGYYHEFSYANHALAVLDLMKNGLGIALLNGFNIAHMIHYDCIIYDDKVLNEHYNHLQNFDLHHYFYKVFEDRIDGNFFSVKVDKFFSLINKFQSKKDYVNVGCAIFEIFLYEVCNKTNLKINRLNIESLFYKNIIDKEKMFTLQYEKEYSETYKTNTYIVPVKNSLNTCVTITSDDPNINFVIINGINYLILVNGVNVFNINKEMLKKKIYIEFPQINYKQILDEDIKFGDLIECDVELVNYFDITN